ncbi:MAG: NAD(P)H-dependent oxidoreductase [Planctomycetota bacterium]|nr:MAG: NAD(P)H-dependent oxidoreductase [Planctomycetota bacterium]
MASPRLIVFAGSTRRESWNRKLAAAAAGMAREAGAEVTPLELADYPMPIMDEDLEAAEGLPANALKLKDLFKAHDGFLVSCPEYNGSITPLLKNTIDWLSRPREGEAQLACFGGKVAGLFGASPGGLGGLRGLVHVRAILSGIGTHVVPAQFALGGAHEAFNPDGSLADAAKAKAVRAVVDATVRTATRLKD